MSRKNKQSRGAKRTEKTKKRAARRSSNVIPIRGRDTSEIDMLIREFERWLPSAEFEDDPDKQAAIVDAVRALDFAVGYALPDHRPTEWSLEEVDAAIDFAEYMEEEEDDAFPASIAVFALRMFVDFLSKTSRWAGTISADIVMGACERYLLDSLGGLQVDVTGIQTSDEHDALSSVSILHRLDVLMDWIGYKRPVTPSGWLKPALLPDLLQALQIEQPTVALKAMKHHRILAETWELARDVQLIVITPSHVYPGPAAASWRGPEALTTRRSTLAAAVGRALTSESGAMAQLVDRIVARVVYHGLTIMPFAADRFASPYDGDLQSPTTTKALSRIQHIIEDGWLVIDRDGDYVVPEGLRPAVWDGVPDAFTPEFGRAATMITLRLELAGVRPRVWRRIRVFSLVPLNELHDVLQVAFGWNDAHLYAFTTPCVDHEHRYLSDEAMGTARAGRYTESVFDSTLGELVDEPGDVLSYEYDFGDGWEVSIVVEAFTPMNDGEPPVAIVAGGGTAPFEDVGGVPGWVDFIEAVNDQTHPRHLELREWAGLTPGSVFDPTSFDIDVVRRRLGV
ncbi:plasmid pRiA4b ORF-3 family protein [Gordonia sp. NPDC127522]|uniref:plasmid pRiA4b ORF-3 family protein n=1 Tax=Gordonia sp. NPDC127522 TaxID=3345390 RepID=UPI0036382B6B